MLNKIFSKANRALLAELVRTDFKLKYQGSVLGYIWSLLRPLLLFGILYVVFVKFLKIGGTIPNYPVYLLLGIVLWNFFTDMTSQSLGSIVARGDLIRKIRIPRWIIVVSSSISALISLTLNLIVISILMFSRGVELSGSAVFLPIIILQIYLLSLGISLILSASFVKYRDVTYIWEVLVQAGFYLTPILYPLSLISNTTYQKLLILNPLAQAIQDARYVLVTKETITINSIYKTWAYHLITASVVILILIIGIGYFKKQSKYFAENI